MAIVRYDETQIGEVFRSLNINARDDASLRIRSGVLTARVKRADGSVQSVTIMLGGKFKQATALVGASLSQRERCKVVKQLTKDGLTQTAIANMLGVSQATVSLDLKK